LLNADQHFGHRRFSSQSSRFNHFLDHATWLLLAPEARFCELAGTISGTVHRVCPAAAAWPCGVVSERRLNDDPALGRRASKIDPEAAELWGCLNCIPNPAAQWTASVFREAPECSEKRPKCDQKSRRRSPFMYEDDVSRSIGEEGFDVGPFERAVKNSPARCEGAHSSEGAPRVGFLLSAARDCFLAKGR